MKGDDYMSFFMKMSKKLYKQYGYTSPSDMLYDYGIWPSVRMKNHTISEFVLLAIKNSIIKK